MANRPKMPTPTQELRPQQLCDMIRRWAQQHGYTFEQRPQTGEFAKLNVRDSDGSFTWSIVPNAHQGRRLKKHQIRYVIQNINNNWGI